MKPVSKEQLQAVSVVRVFFNHQSVGANILSGIDTVSRQLGVTWNVEKVDEASARWPAQTGLWCARLGANAKPKTKIDGFASALRTWSGQRPQLALMKLCYVDVTCATDLPDLMGYYTHAVDELKSAVPEVVIAHMTVPLAPLPDSLKIKIKRTVGRLVHEDRDNLARTRFNRMLRDSFPNDPIFDLERVESTTPGGARNQVAVEGEAVLGLVSAYASDPWGHLNELGSSMAARAFIDFLSSKPSTSASCTRSERTW